MLAKREFSLKADLKACKQKYFLSWSFF